MSNLMSQQWNATNGGNLLAGILMMILSIGCAPTVHHRTVRYEPGSVSLTGTLWRCVFPGRPNFEDIKQGDEPEACVLIRLAAPITVQGNSGNDEGDYNTISEENVTDMQLCIVGDQAWETAKTCMSNNVVVTGTLYHGHTGHHHTEVLMTVQSMMGLSPRRAAR